MSFRVFLLIFAFILIAILMFFAFTGEKSYPQVQDLPDYENIAKIEASK